MGGKQKQAQRTKGNVKPSSSGRSAALLGNVPLSGISGLKDSIFPFFQNVASDDIDPNIDPNFQLVLKKMNKKDSVTRVKALQEFTKLVENSDICTLKAVLPLWPRLYCMLTGDAEHKVREAANDAQRIVAVQAKRNMAPYLHQLAGPWFVAQFDTYPPAASSASRSFKDAFPAGKLLEAVVFCQEDILKFISDNLLDTALTNVGNSERLEKQDRIIIMCLQGYCNFLKIMPKDKLTERSFLQMSENLMKAEEFWKFAIDKISLVRSSWLAVIGVILEKVPQLVSQYHQKIVKCVIGRLGEDDPAVLPYIWQTALNIFVILEDWSSYCNIDAHIYPMLWRVLKEGGYGCASTIYPNMLPLLNSLLEVKGTKFTKETIVDKFFESLREGFSKKTVQQSRSESEAVAQCYIECIRFVGKLNILNTDLVTKHLIPVIHEVTVDCRLNLLSKGIFEHTSSLLRYWSSEETIPQYDTLCQSFWELLCDCHKELLVESVPVSQRIYTLEQQTELYLCLQSSKKLKNKSSHRVRFASDTDNPTPKNNESSPNTENSPVSEKHMKHLQKLIFAMSLFYLQKVNEEKDMSYVKPLSKLLIEFNDPKLFQDLIHNCNFCAIFETILRDSNVCSFAETVVGFFFSISEYLKAEENEEILNAMSENLDIFIWVIRVMKRGTILHFVLEWLRAPCFSMKLIALSQRMCDLNDLSKARSVLMECIAIAPDGGFLVNISTISVILSELVQDHNDLEKATLGAHVLLTLEPMICKGCNLMTKEQKESLSSCTYELVCLLFSLCCKEENVAEDPCFSTGWQKGVKILGEIGILDITVLISNLSTIVWKQLSYRDLSIIDMDSLLELLVNLTRLLMTPSLDVCCLFLDGILPQYKALEQKLRSLCENIEILHGASIDKSKYDEFTVTELEINQYIMLSLFILNFFEKIMSLEKTGYGESNEKYLEDSELLENKENEEKALSVKEESQDIVDFLENRKEILMQIVLSVSICEILKTHFQSVSFYTKSRHYILEIKKKFSELISVFTKSEQNSLINLALERAKSDSGMWVHAVYLLADVDQWFTYYSCLLNSCCSDYSSQIFLTRAAESNLEVQRENLGDMTNFLTIAYFLNYMQEFPSITLTQEINSIICEWKSCSHQELLYDCDISEKPLPEIELIAKKIQFLSVCVRKCPSLMKQDVWDFVIISAAYYTQNLKYLNEFYVNSTDSENILLVPSLKKDKIHKVCVFSTAVFELLTSIVEFCQYVRGKEYEESNFDHVGEWKNVFADDVRLILSDIYISLSESLNEAQLSFLGNVFLLNFCKALKSMYQDYDEDKALKSDLVISCCKLIRSSVNSLQLTAHSILKNIVIHAVRNDTVLTNNENFDENNFNIKKLEIYLLLKSLSEVQSVVDIMLAEFSFGDSCILKPHTDTYYYTAAYLLLWDLVLRACEGAGSELRYQYASLLRSEGYLSALLNNLFYLMPAEILDSAVSKTKLATLTGMFAESPDFSMGKECTSGLLQHWACWVYYCAVSRLPALVRQWWSDAKPKISSMVQKATVQYVTPLLCTRELQAIQNQTTKFKNMEVKVHSKVREVVAVYAIDEAQMELVITLPEEYPLATIQVDSHSSSLVGTSQWRNWVKQLSIFLTHQNGSLWDGLLLWKSNLDKRFEGVEECYICFSILHGTNFQIPKLCCKTCKKKFHSPCLYKWFSTSNKSTCPICRNIF